MVDFIDLVEFCKRHSNKLSKVRVYGKITHEIVNPKSIRSDVILDDGAMCCNMDLIAVGLTDYRSDLSLLGVVTPDDIFFVNGSIAVVISKDTPMNDWYAVDGIIRLANYTKRVPVLGMFDFYKIGNDWALHQSDAFDLPVEDFNKSGRVLDYIYRSDSAEKIIVPDEVKSVTKFFSDESNTIDIDVKQEVLGGFNESWKSINTNPQGTQVTGYDNFKFDSHAELHLGDKFIRMKQLISESLNKSVSLFTSIIDSFALERTGSDAVNFLLSALKEQMVRARGTSLTGQQLIHKYLTSCGANLMIEYLGIPIWKFISDSLFEILDSIQNGNKFTATGIGEEYIDAYFSDAEHLYAGILAEITGLSHQTLISISQSLSKQGISFSKIVTSNPYILYLLSDEITVEEVEYLANCFGLTNSDDISVAGRTIQDYRRVAVLLNYIRNGIFGDTYIDNVDLLSRMIGSYLTASRYTSVSESGSYISKFIMVNACTFLKSGLSIESSKYASDTTWAKTPSGAMRVLSKEEIQMAIDISKEFGLVIEFNDSHGSYVAYTEKVSGDMFFYEKIHDLHSVKNTSIDSIIDKHIADYETALNISLTPNQRQAVKLIKNGALAVDGLVGTGKKTVIDCMKYVLRMINPAIDILEYSFLKRDNLSELLISNSVQQTLIVRGMELSTIDILETIFNNLQGLCRVIFIGDSAAICTQTKGVLFRDILNIVPSQYLSDFESDDIIESNSRALITGAPIKSTANFKLVPCADNEIPLLTYLTCKYHTHTVAGEEEVMLRETCVGRMISSNTMYRSRDIQVISPVDKPDYVWGCYNMNNLLRSAFNTTDNKVIIWGSKGRRVNYKFGDRVVHTKSSISDICYTKTEDGSYKPDKEQSISIGAVGTVVGVFDSRNCMFAGSGVSKDNINYSDMKFVGTGRYFVAVRYKNDTTETNFFVLYRAYLDTENTLDCLSLVGGDCDCIKLHYCSTPFRTVGNESKIVLSLLGSIKYDGYVNRNMLYATWTQAKDMLYVFGDVADGDGLTSQLTKARNESAYFKSKTLGGYLCS